MKIVRSLQLILITMILILPLESSYALYTAKLPKELQTKNTRPAYRTIFLKLPLQQAKFHWIFSNKNKFLDGKLTLDITRNNNTKHIVIYDNGQLNKSWKVITNVPLKKGVYFELISTKTYLTAPGDELKLNWVVKQNLQGIGPCFAGTVPAGNYTSVGKYSGLTDKPNLTKTAFYRIITKGKFSKAQKQKLLQSLNHKAFLESWKPQWKLNITSQNGWLIGKTKTKYCSNDKRQPLS